MDRLNRTMAGCGLMLLLAAGGCRSARPEVPPGRPYSGDGRQAPPVGFSTEPHPMTGPGIAAGGPGAPQLGTPGPATAGNYGTPTNNAYGPPGTTLGGGQSPMQGVGIGSGTEATSAAPMGGLGAPSVGGAEAQGASAGMMGAPGQGQGQMQMQGQAPGSP